MKRLISLVLLVFTFVVALVACNQNISSEVSESSGSSVIDNNEYTVKLSYVSSGGEVAFDKSVVKGGESVTFTITVEKGFYLEDFRINGEDYTKQVTDGKLTVSDVHEDLRIRAMFNKIQEGFEVMYVQNSNLPVIDGNIDDVWSTANEFVVDNFVNDNGTHEDDAATVKVLWNEAGFYFLGIIKDKTVNEADRFNIWVSEIYTDIKQDYSSNKKDGNYAACINPNGVNLLYTALDISPFYTCKTSIVSDGYIVEVFIPVLGENPLVENGYMGLDFSIDYYKSAALSRGSYAYWAGVGSYWSNVGALCSVKLVK